MCSLCFLVLFLLLIQEEEKIIKSLSLIVCRFERRIRNFIQLTSFAFWLNRNKKKEREYLMIAILLFSSTKYIHMQINISPAINKIQFNTACFSLSFFVAVIIIAIIITSKKKKSLLILKMKLTSSNSNTFQAHITENTTNAIDFIVYFKN